MLRGVDDSEFSISGGSSVAADAPPPPTVELYPALPVAARPAELGSFGRGVACPRIVFVSNRKPPTNATEQALLQQGFAVVVVGTLLSARRLLTKPDLYADVVLLDRNLPDGCAEELLSELEQLPRQPGIVILSDNADDFYPDAVMFRAVVVSSFTSATVMGSILRKAAAGCADHTLRRFGQRYTLSLQEIEILGRLAEGSNPKTIAAEADCSLQAIYAHLARICKRTSCDSYPEVVAKLFQFSCHGLGHPMGKGALRIRKRARSQ